MLPKSKMSPESLSEVGCSRLKDFSDRHSYLLSVNRQADAELLVKEGKLLAKALDDGEAFLVTEDLRYTSGQSTPCTSNSTLAEIVNSRLENFSERLEHFLMIGDFQHMELIQDEWNSTLEAFQEGHSFLFPPPFEGYRV